VLYHVIIYIDTTISVIILYMLYINKITLVTVTFKNTMILLYKTRDERFRKQWKAVKLRNFVSRHNQSETYFFYVAVTIRPNLNQGLIHYALLFCHVI